MDIIKFNDFINEDVKIPVLDVLIDNNGNLYNGEQQGFPLRKGNIVQNKSRKLIDIIGQDRKSYPAGIDKNGVLVAVFSSPEGYLLDKNEMFESIKKNNEILKNEDFMNNLIKYL